MSKQLSLSSVSVVIPVCERAENTIPLYKEYKEFLSAEFKELEFIFVINSSFQQKIGQELEELSQQEDNLSVIFMSRDFGEATAIKAGSNQAKGELILILPPYKQINTPAITKLFEHIEDNDLVIGKRWPRVDGQGNQLQTRIFNALLSKFSDQSYTDIGCGVRLIRAEAMKEINLYGDQHRFLPLLAHQIGFLCKEIELPQAQEDAHRRVYRPGVYVRRILDLLTVIFLTKFNKKPLRFFGLIGSANIAMGIFGFIYLAFERLALHIEVSDRPLLVLFSLFFVLGFQLLAIGLIGEIIVFTHAGDRKEYRIKKIISKMTG